MRELDLRNARPLRARLVRFRAIVDVFVPKWWPGSLQMLLLSGRIGIEIKNER